jgi:copper oxidase (laccase) domain-containing protein
LVDAMRELGAADITARVGPSICPGCYPVPQGMRDEIAAVAPAARSTARDGSPALDIGAGVAAQLTERGVDVTRYDGCPAEEPSLYSYRRDAGRTGRYAGLAWLP